MNRSADAKLEKAGQAKGDMKNIKKHIEGSMILFYTLDKERRGRLCCTTATDPKSKKCQLGPPCL
jgi:hypothetical protein